MDAPLPPGSIARPHAPRPKPGARLFIIEGGIAAGKTELTRAVAAELGRRGLRVAAVPEPVDRWAAIGILQMFYDKPVRHGYGFQTYVFATRVQAIAAAVAAQPDADVFLLERSPATDGIFMYAQAPLLDPVEMAMYADWCDAFRLMLPIDLSAAKVLYLKPDLDVCMARLAARSQKGEITDRGEADETSVGGVSLGYQRRLRQLHDAFLLGIGTETCPGLPPSPFPPTAVMCVGPELANLDWRQAGPDAAAIGQMVDMMLAL